MTEENNEQSQASGIESEEKPAFVAPHSYETQSVSEFTPEPEAQKTETKQPEPEAPKVENQPPAPVYSHPVVSESDHLSHTHKPWFYVLTGGLAGLLVGAACVAGCTTIALHNGYGHTSSAPTQSVPAQDSNRNSDTSRDTEDEQNYGNRSDDGYGYGHNHDYNYDHGYGYGYGYGYPYEYPYGYGAPYGYGYEPSPYGQNPYGQTPYGQNPYDRSYGYQNPYGYGYDYGYDLDELFDYLYGDSPEDTTRNSDDNASEKSKNTTPEQKSEDTDDTDNYGGIIDLYDLFGGEGYTDDPSAESAAAKVTLDEIVENFDVPLGDIDGTSYGTGVYTVGKDGIAPGLYYVEGSPSKESNFYLYEAEDDDDRDGLYELEAAVAYIGNYFVELEKGDVIIYKPAESADTFYVADEAPEVGTSPYGSGLYRVGTDIPAGTYKITASPEKLENASQDRAAYVMKDLDFEDDFNLDTKYVMPGGSQTIEVKDGQWVELYGAQAELQK